MLTAGGALAGTSGGALRFACVAEPGIDETRLDLLCRRVGEGIGEALGRDVDIVSGGADVALMVSRLGDSHVRARLHWSGAVPGPDVDLGSVDALLTEQSYVMMVSALLKVSPPP